MIKDDTRHSDAGYQHQREQDDNEHDLLAPQANRMTFIRSARRATHARPTALCAAIALARQDDRDQSIQRLAMNSMDS
ncbi:MAG TPA: hypothetical protein VFF59_01400 [Anaerolineae bacterium]|nr:hypothetical protein [Anaerolineae bacterium]